MSNFDLKPCPFCGSDSDSVCIFSKKYAGCKIRFMEIYCVNCQISITFPWRDQSPIRRIRGEECRREAIEKRNAAALWNKITLGGGR